MDNAFEFEFEQFKLKFESMPSLLYMSWLVFPLVFPNTQKIKPSLIKNHIDWRVN